MRSKHSKEQCEICGTRNKKVIDFHHIIPRTDPRTSHGIGNLAIICSNCHRRVHAHEIIIEGVFMTTGGHALFWHLDGEPHIVRPGVFLRKDGRAEIVN